LKEPPALTEVHRQSPFSGLVYNAKLILIVGGWSSQLKNPRRITPRNRMFLRDRGEDDGIEGEDSHPSSAETVAG
jgi:hypothetical protein